MAIMHKVIKDKEDPAIMEEDAIEIKTIIEEGVGHLEDRIEVEGMREVQVIIGLGQVLEQAQIGIEFNAFVCRVYDHFAQECPVRLAGHTSRETEQIQQMFNMNEDQTLLQTLLMDIDKDEMTITPMDTGGNLNL